MHCFALVTQRRKHSNNMVLQMVLQSGACQQWLCIEFANIDESTEISEPGTFEQGFHPQAGVADIQDDLLGKSFEPAADGD